MVTIGLDLSNMPAFLLLFCRMAGVLIAAPLVGSARVPARLKAALALTTCLLLLPVAGPAPQCRSAAEMALAAGGELLLGLAIGFGASLIFAVVQMVGEMADMQSAFGFAGIVSPQTGERNSVIGQLQMSAAWMIFLIANGHHLVLQGLGASLAAVPLGAGPGFSAPALTSAVGALLAASVRIAAPVVGSVMLADLALGLLARAAPQMNLLAIGFPVKLVIGLGAALLSLPLLAPGVRSLLPVIEATIRDVLLTAR